MGILIYCWWEYKMFIFYGKQFVNHFQNLKMHVYFSGGFFFFGRVAQLVGTYPTKD